jgi:hypothetical protein
MANTLMKRIFETIGLRIFLIYRLNSIPDQSTKASIITSATCVPLTILIRQAIPSAQKGYIFCQSGARTYRSPAGPRRPADRLIFQPDSALAAGMKKVGIRRYHTKVVAEEGIGQYHYSLSFLAQVQVEGTQTALSAFSCRGR